MPMAMLYRRFALARRQRGEPAAPGVVLIAGYFLSWLAFGAIACAAGFDLSDLAMRDERVSRFIPIATAFALVLAGVYQLTPWKLICLGHCRSPLSFVATWWKPGWLGTLRLGIHTARTVPDAAGR